MKHKEQHRNDTDLSWITAKSFVMAMLYISHPLPTSDLDLWVRPESKRYALLYSDMKLYGS